MQILLLDDEKYILSSLARVFKGTAWEIEPFTSADEALEKVKTSSFDIVISDYQMRTMNGVEFLERVYELQPVCMRVLISGEIGMNGLEDAINKAHIDLYVRKPCDHNELLKSLDDCISLQQARCKDYLK